MSIKDFNILSKLGIFKEVYLLAPQVKELIHQFTEPKELQILVNMP